MLCRPWYPKCILLIVVVAVKRQRDNFIYHDRVTQSAQRLVSIAALFILNQTMQNIVKIFKNNIAKRQSKQAKFIQVNSG